MYIDLENYWNLPSDIFIHRIISEGYYDGVQLFELRFGSKADIYLSDANHDETCSIAERIHDFTTLNDQRCFQDLAQYFMHFYTNDPAPLQTSFINKDRIAYGYIAHEIAHQGYNAVFLPGPKTIYLYFAYAISVNDNVALSYLISTFPHSDIITSEKTQIEPLLSLAYRQQNIDAAFMLHNVHDNGNSLIFKPRFLVQDIPLHPVNNYSAHIGAIHSLNNPIMRSLIHTVYDTKFKTFTLAPGSYNLCDILFNNTLSDSTALLGQEKANCHIYTQDPITELVILTLVTYIVSTNGFMRIYITSTNIGDSFYSHPKAYYPFHFHTIFVSNAPGFTSSGFIHEAGHFVDSFLNRNQGKQYKGDYQRDEFLGAIAEFANMTGEKLLLDSLIGREKNLEKKILLMSQSYITILCEVEFHKKYGSTARAKQLNVGLRRYKTQLAINVDTNLYCNSEIVIFTIHRIYEWTTRTTENRHVELLNRLPEIVTQIALAQGEHQSNIEKVLGVLDPLKILWNNRYKPSLTVFVKTTQCARSIFFVPGIQQHCHNAKQKPLPITHNLEHVGSASWSYQFLMSVSALIIGVFLGHMGICKKRRR